MEYRMKQDYLKNNLYEDNAESENILWKILRKVLFINGMINWK